MRKTLLLLAVLFFISPSFVSGLNIPNPSGWVNDFAGIINTDYKTKLDAVIGSLEKQTGSEIAVVTLSSLEGGNIEDFSVRLFKQWGIGKKGKDNGVLVLLSVDDKQVRIETGYGIEPILPDVLTGRVIREAMIPFFKQENYSAGILSGVYRIANIIAQAEGVTLDIRYDELQLPASQTQQPWWLKLIVILILLIIFIRHPFLFLLFSGFGGGRGGFGSSGGGFGGGFGGFGGGLSGGGGATGRW
jgi:uncharacterized protein